jgi:hypothetical protein
MKIDGLERNTEPSYPQSAFRLDVTRMQDYLADNTDSRQLNPQTEMISMFLPAHVPTAARITKCESFIGHKLAFQKERQLCSVVGPHKTKIFANHLREFLHIAGLANRAPFTAGTLQVDSLSYTPAPLAAELVREGSNRSPSVAKFANDSAWLSELINGRHRPYGVVGIRLGSITPMEMRFQCQDNLHSSLGNRIEGRIIRRRGRA